jgi:hypothetical protein
MYHKRLSELSPVNYRFRYLLQSKNIEVEIAAYRIPRTHHICGSPTQAVLSQRIGANPAE